MVKIFIANASRINNLSSYFVSFSAGYSNQNASSRSNTPALSGGSPPHSSPSPVVSIESNQSSNIVPPPMNGKSPGAAQSPRASIDSSSQS